MKCDVHHSVKAGGRYLIVPAGTAVISLGPAITNEFGTPTWKTIDVDETSTLLGLDTPAALRDIKQHGYHIAAAAFLFQESVVR